MTTDFNLLRASLQSERKHLTEELKQLTANIRPAEERREGSPFGKREEAATETLEFEKGQGTKGPKAVNIKLSRKGVQKCFGERNQWQRSH